MEKEHNVISICAPALKRENKVLIDSFLDIGSKLEWLLWNAVHAAQHGNPRCFGYFDDIRAELSEWKDICKLCAKQNFIKNESEAEKSVKEMFFISSHLELIFLYANKNVEQANYFFNELVDSAY